MPANHAHQSHIPAVRLQVHAYLIMHLQIECIGICGWQEAALFVGRVVCDAEGHLNASSLLLEGTLKHSHGASIKLDVSKLPAYRLFPGQVRMASLPCLNQHATHCFDSIAANSE